MEMSKLMIIFILFFCCVQKIKCDLIRPQDFQFGVATASYQIEGGWNEDGKGENIWDRFTHTAKEKVKDHSNGDVACNSYHLWFEDIKMLQDLGVDYYRFSLSWSRILPTGFSNKINKAGVLYYNNLINALQQVGIEPMVTIYHWDLPQPLQDLLGGWTNPYISDYFADYARVVFALFGDRVGQWITINEPASICVDVYENNKGAPDVKMPGIGSYLCGKNVLLAHAKAYEVYQQEFSKSQKGKVGIAIDSTWVDPKSPSNQSDVDAADREMQMSLGWWAHPIFSTEGDYPKIMKSRVANMSRQQNFTRSRLPPLSVEEIKLIKGSADFFGINHYHSWMATTKDYGVGVVSFNADKGTLLEKDPKWKDPTIVPLGFRRLLNWIKDQYNNPLVYVTENGIEDTTGTLNDTHRIEFFKGYISAVFDAANQDGCHVSKYTVWSLMDNMEWTDGYTLKFGLYNVDFKDPLRKRTPKRSAEFFKGIIWGNSV